MRRFEDLERVLYSNSDNNIKPGLERILRLLEEMGNPQDSFKSFQIVGTNGKGSTGAFISSILTESGYKTGFYSSPHLESPGERLLIDDQELSADDWLKSVNVAIEASKKLEILPTYFELLTAGAFELSRNSGIETGVIEAGLGGKLDATNTMSNPICSVIASISIDHTEYLGSTLESVASEKFAIIREKVPAIFSGFDEALILQFLETCREKGAIPFIVSKDAKIENVKVSADENVFDFHLPNLSLKNLRTNLIGNYQIKNASLALSAISQNLETFPKITESSIREGLRKAKWPGRLEIISREPLVILDGGHNFDGVRNLCLSVKNLWPNRKFGIVYAAMKDKDYSGCLRLMSETLRPKLYLTCVPDMARSARPEELLKSSKDYEWSNVPESFENPKEAIEKSLNENDSVMICGSLYFVGWVKRTLSNLL